MKWKTAVAISCASAFIGQAANAQCGIQLLDYIETNGNAIAADALGGIVAVGLGNNGIDFVDASDPAALELFSTIDLGMNARRVAMVSGYALASDGNSTLRIIDLSNPGSPSQVGMLSIPGGASSSQSGLDAEGSIAVLSSPNGGVSIVDFSNPSSPSVISSINPAGFSPRAVAVSGTVLAVADGSTARLYDISDPALPIARGSISFGSNINDLLIDGDELFVADYGGSVVDISDLDNPLVVPSSYLGFGQAAIAGDADRLFGFDEELLNLEISVPDPNMTGRTKFGVRVTNFTELRDLAAADEIAFLAGGSAGLIAFDTSNPDSGPNLRSYAISQSPEPTSIAATPSVLAAVNYHFTPGTLKFYDISNPANLVNPYVSGWSDNSYVSAAAKNDIIYAAYEAYDFPSQPDVEEPGVLIISAASPGSISVIDTLDIGARQLHVDGDDLYARGGNTVWQYDLTDPSSPVLAASGSVSGITGDKMTASNGYMMISGASQNVIIVDMQNSGGPSLVSQIAVGFSVSHITANDHLIVAFEGASGSSQVAFIDYSNPSAPMILNTGPLGQEFPRSLDYVFGVIEGDVLYATDYFGPIHCYSLINPNDPELFSMGNDAENYLGTIAFYNNTIFAGGFGINVIDPPSCIPTSPSCPGDVTGDGETDLADLNLVLANFGQTTSEGDTNNDGVVDLADLNAVLANFGTGCD
ncbi:MAG: hypothetical protein ACF8MJ_12130 [Phycisphaerales bacterium JB050]